MSSKHSIGHADDASSIVDSEVPTIEPSDIFGNIPDPKSSCGSENEDMTDEGTSDGNLDDEDGDDDDEDENSELAKSEDVWPRIIQGILNNDKDITVNSDGTLNMSKFAKRIRDVAEWHIALAREIRETDVYKQIRKTAKRLQNQEYEEDEAINVAWKMRKYLVRKEIIEPNLHLIEDEEEEDDDDML